MAERIAERKRHFRHLPHFHPKDLVPTNPRAILADLIIALGTLAGFKGLIYVQNTINAPATSVPQSRSADIPPVLTPTVINGEAMSVAPMAPTEIADLQARIATATKESPPTAIPTTAPAEIATPVPEIMKPQSEKTFPTGLVERYGMVTEKNFDQYFSRVSPEEMQKLLKEQPDLPLFPFIPLSDQFSIGETLSTSPLDGQNGIDIKVYSPHLAMVAGIDGKLYFMKQGANFYGLGILQDLSERTKIQFQMQILGTNSKFKPAIDAPVWTGNTPVGVPVQKGQLLAEFFGSDAINRATYSGSENQVDLTVYQLDKLDEPIRVKTDMGTVTMTNKITDLVSSLSNPSGWKHTADGKIAILRL